MIRHRHLLSLVVCAFVAAQSSLPVWGVQYAIVAPQSSYVYFIPPEGPGIAGCLPDAFHCRSGLAGSFEFNVANGQGTFVDPDLVLSDVEGGTATLLEQVLTGVISPLPLESTIDGTQLFRQPIPVPPRLRINSIEVRITGNELSLIGAYDNTGADGDGHVFDVRAVAVPEPISAVLSVAAIAAGLVVRARRLVCPTRICST